MSGDKKMGKHGPEKKHKTWVVGATLICLAFTGCGEKSTPTTSSQASLDTPTKEMVSETVQCPVCGLSFPKSKTAKEHEHLGKKYFFYLEDHYNEFSKNPQKYIIK